VVLTDPTYAGMINRVRLAGAVPRLAPLVADTGEWRLDLEALHAVVSDRTRAVFINNASFPSGWERPPTSCRRSPRYVANGMPGSSIGPDSKVCSSTAAAQLTQLPSKECATAR
jgi:hypothetical protein